MDIHKTFCVICEKALVGRTVVVKKGLAAIRAASLKRNDDIHEKLNGKTAIEVHVSCRQQYTRENSIKAALARESIGGEPEFSKNSTRKSQDIFDFKRSCFICGKEAIISSRLAKDRRDLIHLVATLEFRDNFLKKCDDRDDDLGNIVKSRLLNIIDLVAAEGRYHFHCYRDFSRTPKKAPSQKGRPKSQVLSEAFSQLCDTMENSDECQYTVKELLEMLENISGEKTVCSETYLKILLKERFEDRVMFSNITGRKNVICLSSSVHKIIDSWYRTDRKTDPNAERLRIVLAAADIIREDIQKMTYDRTVYPDIETIKSGGKRFVPESLDAFSLQLTRKRNPSELRQTGVKRDVINNAIISCVRPRSFLSPIQISLGLTLHRLYGSKHLIQILSGMGVCASYHETSVYETSLINAGLPEVHGDAFVQYVFDNADVNVKTLDGHGTFHAMGGIKCITPASSVETTIETERITCGSFNTESIRHYSYPKKTKGCSGLSSIFIEDYDVIKGNKTLYPDTLIRYSHSLSPLDLVWLSVRSHQPGWNGFMANITKGCNNFETAYIMPVPFINLDPSDLSTIYSAMRFAVKESQSRGQTCIITFDQPLFLKASEIVASADLESDIAKIVLRLGGFHLLISFIGSIGKIMEGSGLENLWETVYGKTTVNHMMSGHAYERCIRALTLTVSAIVTVMEEKYPEVAECFNNVQFAFDKLSSGESQLSDILKNDEVSKILLTFDDCLKTIENTSRTAKLWINLLRAVGLVLKFLYAERSGDWNIHLQTTIDMLPIFHAAGHLPYAKSAHLYAQQMLNLSCKLSESELELFINNGFFTVRRTSKFWCGTWADMCIEQSLMRPMKSIGGLTHGRGITDSTLSKWILATPFFLKISEALEEYIGVSVKYGEQHVELRESRKQRDLVDTEKLTVWLRQHNPFTKMSGELVCLSSGRISDGSVNCDQAIELGLSAMNRMKGKTFGELKLRRKDMIINQARHKIAKVGLKEVVINPQQLFNRIVCVCDSPQKLKHYLEYELASRPPSLFDEVSLRKSNKSSAIKIFEKGIVSDETVLTDALVVVDGGFLLHWVPWPKNGTYGEVIQNYVSFLIKTYGRNVTVIFDGYPDSGSTKQEEQSRRSARRTSCNIAFDENTICMTPKEDFLGNKNNKRKLINSIRNYFIQENIETVQSDGDADVDIVQNACEKSSSNSKVVVVGSDTDLLFLLVALSPETANIYFLKYVFGKNPTKFCYEIKRLAKLFKETRKLLLFAYAVSGCDTTSSFFGIGKMKSIEKVSSSIEAQNQARVFTEQDVSQVEILGKGEEFILGMYGMSKYSNLNEARYYVFSKLTKKSALRSNFDLARLPPTSEAAYQHLLRVYLQVQTWLGHKLLPTEWGWKEEIVGDIEGTRKTLTPVVSSKAFAPDELLRLVSCSCKTFCTKYCGCRKALLQCTSMCEHCNGLSCYNSPSALEDTVDDIS